MKHAQRWGMLLAALAVTTAPAEDPAPIVLPGIDGQSHTLLSAGDEHVTVVIFVTSVCPIANSYAPTIQALADGWRGRPVRVAVVHVDPDLSDTDARRHAEEYGYRVPVLLDRRHELVRRAGATKTPEAAVFDGRHALRYLGRIDNRWADYGVQRAAASQQDLRDAVEALLAGRAPERERTEAIGCDLPAPAPPTYARDIAPIIYRQCTVCHRDGEVAPFALTGYRDVQKRAAQIERMVRARQMPPWLAEAGPHPFQGERRLSDEEIATISRWVHAGAPEGDPAEVPPMPDFPTGWWLGTPDLVLTMDQPYEVPADSRDIYRCFVFPTDLPEDKWVTAVEYHAGNARVVHHALFFLDSRGRGRRLDERDAAPGYDSYTGPGFMPDAGLGGWAPGAFPKRLPEGTARRLPAGADVVVQVHFHPTGKPETERSTIGLYFTDTPPTREIHIAPLGTYLLAIPPGRSDHVVNDEFVVPVDVELHGIVPHAHLLGRSMESWATFPDGSRIPLLQIPRWNFNWQEQYRYQRPVDLPAGTKVSMRWVYDNSADNPLNPHNPPKLVTFGLGTNDEMCCLWLQIIAKDPNDLPALREALARQERGRVGGDFL